MTLPDRTSPQTRDGVEHRVAQCSELVFLVSVVDHARRGHHGVDEHSLLRERLEVGTAEPVLQVLYCSGQPGEPFLAPLAAASSPQ